MIDFGAAPASLARSLDAVVALRAGRAVGMGRLVDDGAIYHDLQDVAVPPSVHGRGAVRDG